MMCNFSGNLKAAQVCFFHPLLTAWGTVTEAIASLRHSRKSCSGFRLLSHSRWSHILPCLEKWDPPCHPLVQALSQKTEHRPNRVLCGTFLSWMEKMSEIPSPSRWSKKTDHLHLISELTYSSEWYVTLLVSSGLQEQHIWVAESTDSYSHSFGGWEFQDAGTFESRWTLSSWLAESHLLPTSSCGLSLIYFWSPLLCLGFL